MAEVAQQFESMADAGAFKTFT